MNSTEKDATGGWVFTHTPIHKGQASLCILQVNGFLYKLACLSGQEYVALSKMAKALRVAL